MSTTYPTTIDTFPAIGPTTQEDDTGKEHDVMHTNTFDAVLALQAKVGADASAVSTSLDYRIAALEARPVGGGGSGAVYFA